VVESHRDLTAYFKKLKRGRPHRERGNRRH